MDSASPIMQYGVWEHCWLTHILWLVIRVHDNLMDLLCLPTESVNWFWNPHLNINLCKNFYSTWVPPACEYTDHTLSVGRFDSKGENWTPAIICQSYEIWSPFIHSGYFYSTSSSSLLLRAAPVYSIDTVSELTCQSAAGNCEWRTCPRFLLGGWFEPANFRTWGSEPTTEPPCPTKSLTCHSNGCPWASLRNCSPSISCYVAGS